MPNALERELRRTRALIVAEDRAAQQRLAALYRQAVEGLEFSLSRLADIPVEEMTPGQVIADARYRQLLAEADAAFARFARDGEVATQDARLRAARIGQQQALPLMQAAAPDVLATAFTRLPEAALQELLGVLGPDAPLRAVLDRYGVRGAEIIERELIQGMARGVNSRRIAAAIRRELGGEAWRAEMLARTETHRAFRGATLQTYARHPHILDGWRWSAAKSTRTCLACLALDGDIFPLTETFMRAHVACRCSCSPYRKGGPQPAQTGQEWFDAQDEDTRRRMLPKGAWDDYAAGRLTLRDFVQEDESAVWGASFRQGSLTSARARAGKRASAAPNGRDLGRFDIDGYTHDAKAMKKEVAAAFKRSQKQMTGPEGNALRAYKGASYRQINGHLRGTLPTPYGASYDTLAGFIDSAIDRAVVDHDMRLFRARGFSEGITDEWANIRPGDIITDKGFISTSMSEERVEGFGGYIMEIYAPKGTRGLSLDSFAPDDISKKEQEVLLPRNTNFLVRRVVAGGGQDGYDRLILEVIP